MKDKPLETFSPWVRITASAIAGTVGFATPAILVAWLLGSNWEKKATQFIDWLYSGQAGFLGVCPAWWILAAFGGLYAANLTRSKIKREKKDAGA